MNKSLVALDLKTFQSKEIAQRHMHSARQLSQRMSFHSLVALRQHATQSFVVQVANHYEPDQKATPRHTLTQLLELLRELLLQTRTNSRAMGLDQVLFKKIPTTYSDNKDEYVQVLVLREEQASLDAYLREWGSEYIIAVMPKEMEVRYACDSAARTLHDDVGGIGYARLFC